MLLAAVRPNHVRPSVGCALTLTASRASIIVFIIPALLGFFIPMACSDEAEKCLLHRGRSQSDPNILIESGGDSARSSDMMEQQRVLRSSCLVSGVHTPPIRRHSKLATLGRLFRPWKWRKKKNEKLKQSSTDVALACGLHSPDPGSPIQGVSDADLRLPGPQGPIMSISSMEYLSSDHDHLPTVSDTVEDGEASDEPNRSDEEEEEEVAPEDNSEGEDSDAEEREEDESPQRQSPPSNHGIPQLSPEEDPAKVAVTAVPQPNSFLPKDVPRVPEGPSPVVLRGPFSNPVGSPHIGTMHPPLPPSCIIEELHRALATKLRQESTDREPSGEVENRKEAEENKENVRQSQCFTDASGIIYDMDSWNESVISGTLPRRMRKELLAVKLRNRPSKQELEDRNIFPARSDQERQEIRQQIEMKLAKRLSQRPAVEELESRNILKQRNDQTEQEERREIKQRLNRKLNQRPTVDELRDRKILIRFSDYVEVAKAQDYDRRADKPWTRLSAADKAAIRKELNEFKSTEMEVHASSKHLTRFHRP
ncbi:phosphatase and actin regulator 3a isoform X1 [Astyanax mexicanus]|uniref:Phosphatase and actin regulator n=2 Tax=Astyanax mexicanus TaxID=7994 RepID=A0A8T2LF51_ASTMX|nr:phosphatase and actin regulator 3a isoform X1 [Astyanax mexicanus]KAG9269477.1 phosphatase and actin regulator 3-like [Astyanax mexicanus]